MSVCEKLSSVSAYSVFLNRKVVNRFHFPCLKKFITSIRNKSHEITDICKIKNVEPLITPIFPIEIRTIYAPPSVL